MCDVERTKAEPKELTEVEATEEGSHYLAKGDGSHLDSLVKVRLRREIS